MECLLLVSSQAKIVYLFAVLHTMLCDLQLGDDRWEKNVYKREDPRFVVECHAMCEKA